MRRIDVGPAGKILGTVAILAALAWIAVETPRSLVATLGLVPVLMLAALIWGPAMCASGARLFSGSLFWPEVEGVPHAPLAALDAHIVAERWDVAEAEVRGLCRQWPADPEVWTRRIQLAWRLPVDLDRAREAHRAVLRWVADPGEVERLGRLYLMLAESRLVDPAMIEQERLGCGERRARWCGRKTCGAGARKTTCSAREVCRCTLLQQYKARAKPRAKLGERGHIGELPKTMSSHGLDCYAAQSGTKPAGTCG